MGGCASSADKSAAPSKIVEQDADPSNREPPISQFSGSGAKDEPDATFERESSANSWAADLAAHHSQRRNDSLLKKSTKTDIFLTHDWANDELGRNNHERVKKVYHRLTVSHPRSYEGIFGR
ncbi:hypothetical protein T484DRAFT_1835053 [Baffinella frigidus]|nr:hypothetical protein T484DRAFT_1835053 [Cryptophyta sp. CCMP2293]